MEIIQNKEYYHISNKSNFGVGKTLFFGNNINYFFSFFEKNKYGFKAGDKFHLSRTFLNHVNKVLKENVEKDQELSQHFNYDPIKTIGIATEILTKYFMIVRELVYEEVRIKHFPNSPSRMRCIWVIPKDKKSVEYWKTIKKGKIYLLRLTGKILRTNEKFLINDTESLDEYRRMAFLYWAGIKGKSEQDEVLFEGYVNVVKEIQIENIE